MQLINYENASRLMDEAERRCEECQSVGDYYPGLVSAAGSTFLTPDRPQHTDFPALRSL